MATPVRRPNCGAATPRPIDRVDLEQQLTGLARAYDGAGRSETLQSMRPLPWSRLLSLQFFHRLVRGGGDRGGPQKALRDSLGRVCG